MQIIIDCHDLFRGIGRPGLLAVAKSSIRNPDFLRHIVRHNSVIEGNLGHLRIGKHIAEYIRLLYIIQNVHMFLYLQQIAVLVHGDRPVLKSVILSHIPIPPFVS